MSMSPHPQGPHPTPTWGAHLLFVGLPEDPYLPVVDLAGRPVVVDHAALQLIAGTGASLVERLHGPEGQGLLELKDCYN